MEDPIEVIQHSISDKPRLGNNGTPYKEKKYSIKKSNLSGRCDLGIGTFRLNKSGENPVSIAGLNDKSLTYHSPESILN